MSHLPSRRAPIDETPEQSRPQKRKVRVLIVDDSPTMRRLIASVLEADPRLEVVALAADAREARDAVVALRPDVITLDIEMPGMNGIDFLQRLMRRRPTPVIMVSTLTQRGSALAIEAMSRGAVDCVGKPEMPPPGGLFADLAEKIIAAAQAPLRALGPADRPAHRPFSSAADNDYRPNDRIVVMGASTGGVDALARLLSGFPRNCPPTVIVQHMPTGFTRSFAERLSRTCAPDVSEARDGDLLRPGLVLIAPGGERHLEIQGRTRPRCLLAASPPVSDHRPSVDVMFHSAARLGSRAVGVILTGMGHDGAEGLLAMRRCGATTIGQDRGSSVVFGMPRVAAELGAVECLLPLRRIGPQLLELCRGG